MKNHYIKHFIKLRSGGFFDFERAVPEDIVLDDIAHALSIIPRFTGHSRRPYTVAEHSVWCCRVAQDRSLDIQTQRWCLMHDASEAYLGDVAAPLKALLPRYQWYEEKVQGLIRIRFRLGTMPPEVHLIDREALEWEFQNVFHAPPSKHEIPCKEDFLREAKRLEIV